MGFGDKWGILNLAKSLAPEAPKEPKESVWDQVSDHMDAEAKRKAKEREDYRKQTPLQMINAAPQAMRLGARRASPPHITKQIDPSPDRDNYADIARRAAAEAAASGGRTAVDAFRDKWGGSTETTDSPGGSVGQFLTQVGKFATNPAGFAMAKILPQDFSAITDFKPGSSVREKAAHFTKRTFDSEASDMLGGLVSKFTNIPEMSREMERLAPKPSNWSGIPALKDIKHPAPVMNYLGEKIKQGLIKIDPDANPIGSNTVTRGLLDLANLALTGGTKGFSTSAVPPGQDEETLGSTKVPQALMELIKRANEGVPGAAEAVQKHLKAGAPAEGWIGFDKKVDKPFDVGKAVSTLPRDAVALAAMAPMMGSWLFRRTDPRDDVALFGTLATETARDTFEPLLDPKTAGERSLLNAAVVPNWILRGPMRWGQKNLPVSRKMPLTSEQYHADLKSLVGQKQEAVGKLAAAEQGLKKRTQIDELRESLAQVEKGEGELTAGVPAEGILPDHALPQAASRRILAQEKARLTSQLEKLGDDGVSGPETVKAAQASLDNIDVMLAKTKGYVDTVQMLEIPSLLAAESGSILSAPDITKKLLRRYLLDTNLSKTKWVTMLKSERLPEAAQQVIREQSYNLTKREGDLQDILSYIPKNKRELVFDTMNMEADHLLTRTDAEGNRRPVVEYTPERGYEIAEGIDLSLPERKDLAIKIQAMNQYAVPMRKFVDNLTSDANDLGLFYDAEGLITHYFPNLYDDSAKALKIAEAGKLGLLESLPSLKEVSKSSKRDIGMTSIGNRFMERTLKDVPIASRIKHLGMLDDLNTVASRGLGQLMTDINRLQLYRKLSKIDGVSINYDGFKALPPELSSRYRRVSDDNFILDDTINAEFEKKVDQHRAEGRSKRDAEKLALSEQRQANKARTALDKSSGKLDEAKTSEALNKKIAEIHAKAEKELAKAEFDADAALTELRDNDPRQALKDDHGVAIELTAEARTAKGSLDAKLKAARKDLKAAEKAKRDLKTEQTRHEKAVKAKVAAAAKLERVKEGGHIKKAEAKDATARQAYERQKEAIASGSNKKKQEHARALLKKREKQLAAMAEDSPKRAQQEKSVSNARAKYELSLEDDGYKLARLAETQSATGRALTTARRNQLLKDTTAELAKASELVEGHAAAIAELEPLTKRDYSTLRAKVAGLEHRLEKGVTEVESAKTLTAEASEAAKAGRKDYPARMKALRAKHKEIAQGIKGEGVRDLKYHVSTDLAGKKSVRFNAARFQKKAEASAAKAEEMWSRVQLELGELQRFGDTDARVAETALERQKHADAQAPYKAPKKYGDIAGKYMDRDLLMELEMVEKISASMKGVLGRLNRIIKVNKTAYSLTTTMRNGWTNVFLFAPMAETPGGRSLALTDHRNLPVYAETLKEMTDGKRGTLMREAINDGSTRGTMVHAEIGEPLGHLRGLFDTVEGAVEGFAQGAIDIAVGNPKGRFSQAAKKSKQSIRHIVDLPVKFYSALDDIFRTTYYKVHMQEAMAKYSPEKMKAVQRSRRQEVTQVQFDEMPRKEQVEYRQHRNKDKGEWLPEETAWVNEWKSDRVAASKNARDYFINYEDVAGWVQLLRAPVGPFGGLYSFIAQPFMAFPAQATPYMMRWLEKNPFRATLYQNLFDTMTQHNLRLAAENEGITEKRNEGYPGNYGIDRGQTFAREVTNSAKAQGPYDIARRVSAAALGPDEAISAFKPDGTPIAGMADGSPLSPLGFWFPNYDDLQDKGSNAMDYVLKYVGSNPVIGTILEIAMNLDTFSGNKLYGDKEKAGSKAIRSAQHVIRKTAPPWAPNFMDLANSLAGPQEGGKTWSDANDLARGKGGTTYDKKTSAEEGKESYYGRKRTPSEVTSSIFWGINRSGVTTREMLTGKMLRAIKGLPELQSFLRKDEGVTVAQKRADPDIAAKLTAKEGRLGLPGVLKLLEVANDLKGSDEIVDDNMGMVQFLVDDLPNMDTIEDQAQNWREIKKYIRKAAGVERESQFMNAMDKVK